MKLGSVLECSRNIYLVKEIYKCGTIVAGLCGRDGEVFFVAPGVNLYINSNNIDEYKVVGEAEVI